MQGLHAQGFLSDIVRICKRHCNPLFSTVVMTSENSQYFVSSPPFLNISLRRTVGWWVLGWEMQHAGSCVSLLAYHFSMFIESGCFNQSFSLAIAGKFLGLTVSLLFLFISLGIKGGSSVILHHSAALPRS